jgi:predicted DNA-binding transcriptional regulator YafY
MFSKDEAQALVAAVRVGQSQLDAALAGQAETALSKIVSALPAAARAAAESLAVDAPAAAVDPDTRERLEKLRVAAETHHKLNLRYVDLKDIETERTVRPLGCFFWGAVWTLAAWCELRQGFRSFRVDRIRELRLCDERFRDEPGKTLADLMRQAANERAERDSSIDA